MALQVATLYRIIFNWDQNEIKGSAHKICTISKNISIKQLT